ncbi:glycosyltransferase (plasmid) [Sphingomonas aurantiaca]
MTTVPLAIRHVFLTRFNLATPGREARHRVRASWLEERFDLFERYCLPTMAAQTEQDFAWLIYFDDQTPDWARARIERARGVRDFHPCYTALFDADGWARTTLHVVDDDRRDVLLTSNLDNDDGLAGDYVARVQAAARAAWTGRRIALNVTEGFVMQGNALYRHRHRFNAFSNLLESHEAPKVVHAYSHMEIADHMPMVQVGGGGGWLQVVHNDNVSNRVRGTRVGRVEALVRFPAGVVRDVCDPGIAALATDRLVTGPARGLRDLATHLAHRVLAWTGLRKSRR